MARKLKKYLTKLGYFSLVSSYFGGMGVLGLISLPEVLKDYKEKSKKIIVGGYLALLSFSTTLYGMVNTIKGNTYYERVGKIVDQIIKKAEKKEKELENKLLLYANKKDKNNEDVVIFTIKKKIDDGFFSYEKMYKVIVEPLPFYQPLRENFEKFKGNIKEKDARAMKYFYSLPLVNLVVIADDLWNRKFGNYKKEKEELEKMYEDWLKKQENTFEELIKRKDENIYHVILEDKYGYQQDSFYTMAKSKEDAKKKIKELYNI
jgi:hypothetical protein